MFDNLNQGSWIGTVFTIFILACGIFYGNLSRSAQLVVKRTEFRMSMIAVIIISKVFNDIFAICLAILIVTVLHVYSIKSDEANNVQSTGISKEEYTQLLEELTVIKQKK